MSLKGQVYGQAQIGQFVGEDYLFINPKELKSFQYHDTARGMEESFLLEITLDGLKRIRYELA